jgi:hypothetical protein
MAKITIKIEGADKLKQILQEKRNDVLAAGEKVISQHMDKQLSAAKSKIHHISGETAASLKVKFDLKGKGALVGRIGAFDCTAEEAIRANSLEFGHAAKGNSRGPKIVPAYPYLRPALYEDERAYKRDLREAIRKAIGD